MKTADVLVWLKDSPIPVKAGEFSWLGKSSVPSGQFQYAESYLNNPDRFVLDPVKLPVKRGKAKEVANKGFFGVIRDSGPDSWGRDHLQTLLGELDDLECIIQAGSDGVGAIKLGPYDSEGLYLSLEDLNVASKVAMAGTSKEAVNEVINLAINPITSLGGAKPKITVQHEGELWIAKFPEKADSAFFAHNEHAMLSLAKQLNIDAAESLIHKLPDGRFILLVKRFDRYQVEGGHARIPYASAHTVLGLEGNASTDSAKKSYPQLAEVSQRWTGEAHVNVAKDLWERMVFNGLVGNIDDHARNHGFLFDYDQGVWRLSPAFDIVAFPSTGNIALSLRIGPHGAIVSEESLLNSATFFGLDKDFAKARLVEMAVAINKGWKDLLRENNVSEQYIEHLRPAFRIAEQIAAV